MKKILAVLTVCAVFGAGAAFAHEKNHVNQQQAHHPVLDWQSKQDNGDVVREHRNQQMMNHPEFNGQPGAGKMFGHCRNGRRGMNFSPDMPTEIREKAVELAKLRVDLEEAMSSKPLNKAKALDTFAKIQKLEQEVRAWRFAQKLERIEEFRKQMELNKNAAPAPEQAKDAPAK